MISPAGPTDPMPRAMVEQGVLVGREAEGVRSFKGAPYARPPVGELRWRAPRPAEPWSGERDAGQVGAICIQPPANGDNGVGPLPMSEDCLTLNVWTPAESDGPLPVMVWIHGGGLNNGSGTAALYDGTNLAKRGAVVVTINYRLGRLGFFDHPALAAERAPGEPAANYGLMDVVEALRWVRDNAEAFGGDAGKVTIFGESAGGALVTRLMISPEARGLFHRAVVQSGLGREEGTPLTARRRDGGPSLQMRGAAFIDGLDLTGSTADDLRALPAEALLTPPPNFYGGDLLVIDGDDRVRRRLTVHKVARNPQAGIALITLDGQGFVSIDPEPLIEGEDITDVRAATDEAGRSRVVVRFHDDGARALEALTRAHAGRQFAVVMEGVVLSTAILPSGITDGVLELEGGASLEEAERLTEILDVGRPGNLVMEDVEAAFAAGREAPVPLIIGTNSAEFWWMKPSDLSPYGALDDAMTEEERAAFLKAYDGQDGYDAHVLSDLVFNEPARRLARLHARNGHPTYLYRFDVVSAAMPEPHAGATHASERQYVFDNLTASPWPTAEMDQRQADVMAGYWTTFAAKGDPNGGVRPTWPEFGAEPDRLLEFTNDGPAAKPVPFAERLDLIEAYYTRVR